MTAISLVTLVYMAVGPVNETVARFTAWAQGRERPGEVVTLVREVLRRTVQWGGAGVLLAALAGPAWMGWLHLDTYMMVLITLGVIFLNLQLAVPRGVLRGSQAFGRYSINIVAEALARLIVGIVLIAWLGSASAAVSAYAIGLAVALVLARVDLVGILAGEEPAPVDGQAVKRFTRSMVVLALAAAALQNIDMLLVQHFFASGRSAEAGTYGAAFTLSRGVSVAFGPYSIMALPLLTSLHSREQSVAPTLTKITIYFLAAAGLLLLAVALLADQIVLLAFGTEFLSAGDLLFPMFLARVGTLVAYLFALGSVAVDRSAAVYVLVAAVLVEAILLSVWHDALLQVAWLVLIVQAASAVAAGLAFFITYRGKSPS